MTATQFVQGVGSNGASPLALSGYTPFAATTVVFVLVAFPTVTPSVSGIAVTTGGATGTFSRIGNTSAGSLGLDLWIGYNFTGSPTAISVTWTGGGNAEVITTVVFCDSAANAAPTATLGTPTSGTATTADSGTVTPLAVGDVLVATAVWANTAASTARTSTGNTFAFNQERTGTSPVAAVAFCTAQAAASSRLQWTITSAAYLGLIASLRMPAPATPAAAFVYKGRDTATADAGTVA